ncbi:phosphotransferase enzyme family protein [Bacillus sp. FJAT-45350]|uniref:phosphotransferase enzyme family protein n=1 Tax=Bacillus sp. FJAT-45350 TaxID=2011014 RepID=UPI000BB6A4CE|nr:phosphotransferase [Bacillus sp. FJAT-45350]
MSNSHYEPMKHLIEHFHLISRLAIFKYPNHDDLEVKLLDYSENATYLVKNKKNNEKMILRVCRPNYHKKGQIKSEIEWMLDIDKNSEVEVSSPIQGRDGEYVQSVISPIDNNEYYCTMYTFLEGEAPDESDEVNLIKQFELLGEVTASLHNHSESWDRVNRIDRDPWNYETILGDNPKWGKWEDGKAITPERKLLFQKVSNTIKKRLELFGTSKDRYGLIHADLRLANLLVHDNQIKVIDFDDCGFGWYLFDIGSALSFIEHKPYVPELVKAWVKGYRKKRTLSLKDEKEIPTFIMMRRLMLISWIGSRDNETTRKLGETYTIQTDNLANQYLKVFKNN